MKFAQILRRRRKELRLTQREIAETLGIRDVNVSDWENGRGMPEASRLPALARRLEMTVSELMGDARTAMGGKPPRYRGPVEGAISDESEDDPSYELPARPAPSRLQWVSEDEAQLLSSYRGATERSRGDIQKMAASLPRASEQELAEVLLLRK
jgi:transcriptional regulator with XRE-family HTH domain